MQIAPANNVQRPFPRGLLVFGLLVVTLWGISEAAPLLIPLSVSALLAFLMAPVLRLMRRRGVPEGVAIAVSALLLILPFISVGYLLVRQGESLIHDYPAILASLNNTLHGFAQSSWGQKLGLDSSFDISGLGQKLASEAGRGVGIAVASLGALLGATSKIALVLLFAVLMLASRAHLRRSGERILARNESIQGAKLLDDVSILIQRFLVARLTIVVIIAVADAAILRAFGLNYAILMGTILGVMTLLPGVGFILGAIPAVVVALASGKSFGATLAMVACLVVMSIVEGNILSPKMVGKKLNINALSTFVGFFGGGLIWGIPGMLLSLPVLGILRIAMSASPHLQPWGDLLAEKNEIPMDIERESKKAREKKVA